MARQKQPCKNHPDRLTSRRCYYCKQPICSACQHHFEHHIFCGKRCYYRWKIQQVAQKLKPGANFQKWAFVGGILVLFVAFFLYFNHQLQQIRHQLKRTANVSVQHVDSTWFVLDSTLFKAEGRLSFKIQGQGRAAVSLWQNGRLIAMKTNDASHNAFVNIPLHFGENRFVLWQHWPDGRTVLLDSIHVQWTSARLKFLMRPVFYVPLQEKKLALTFDAGSTDRGSLKILQILRQKRVACTMFVTGQFIRHYPQVIRQMVWNGIEIGNHTFSHPHLTTYAQNNLHKTLPGVNALLLREQLQRTDSLFYSVTKRHLAPLWRAPFGEYNRTILQWAAESGYKLVGWSQKCDALDWVADSTEKWYRTPEQILDHFLRLESEKGLEGKIILMHLGTDRSKDFPYTILPALIDSLRQRGYQFCTVSALINAKARQSGHKRRIVREGR